MQKPICLSLLITLALTGCGVFRGSETWSKVRAVRVDTRGEADPSAAYAARLSEQLTAANIEHQVVTYQFRYRTHVSEEAIATRTAVIYRDDVNPRYPWWLMDERLSQPFWLPSGDLAQQISFYVRTPVDLVESKAGGRDGSGKSMSVPVRERREREMQPAPAIAFRTSPPSYSAAHLEETKRAWPRSRTGKDPASPAEQRATATADFRALHGTAFNPLSAIDRRKMEQIRQRGRGFAGAY